MFAQGPSDRQRVETLRKLAATFGPIDARIDRVACYAADAIVRLSPHRRAEMEQLLDALRLPMIGIGMTRAAALAMLARAPSQRVRSGFAALKRLILFLAYAESEPGSENPTWRRIGYPGPRGDTPAGVPPMPLATARDGERVFADIVVVGSGAGASVIASEFARSGRRVVVLEAGGAYDARSFDQREMMLSHLYLDGGLTASSDLGVAILAGSCVGGGTTVNWCTALRLPERIGQEWVAYSGIEGLDSQLYTHFQRIERRLDVRPAQNHNANNRVILDGAKALGVHVAQTPRNASADCGDGCGYCGFGCIYAKKHSAATTYLLDVAANGGAIYACAPAVRIDADAERARGVIARQMAGPDDVRTFSVQAELVAICAGTLRTPGLLARSGIARPLLGRRLFLHPVAGAIAEFDRPIEAWKGPMQSLYSDAFNYRCGNYGVKIEVAPAHPGLAALALPWEGPGKHAGLMERVRNCAAIFALTRDRDPGSIDLDDEAQIRYRVSDFDGDNMLAGLAGIVELAFAAGAQRVMTLHQPPLELVRSEWSARARRELRDRLRAIGTAPNRQILFSAHQMGSAAMGADCQRSVVDPRGRVWGFENLIIADASIFPQSSGVNPMLTVMAMAARVAQLNGASTSSCAP